jgi:hypothetical protein
LSVRAVGFHLLVCGCGVLVFSLVARSGVVAGGIVASLVLALDGCAAAIVEGGAEQCRDDDERRDYE